MIVKTILCFNIFRNIFGLQLAVGTIYFIVQSRAGCNAMLTLLYVLRAECVLGTQSPKILRSVGDGRQRLPCLRRKNLTPNSPNTHTSTPSKDLIKDSRIQSLNWILTI